MSLDVWLIGDMCEYCGRGDEEVYSANITHNLGEMAREAGIYQTLWRPEELNFTKAKHLIPKLERGLRRLKDRPTFFKKFDSPNGWGLYVNFVPFVEKYLDAYQKNPEASVSVSR